MKTYLRIAILSVKQTLRHRTRSLLTIIGVATGMFLYTSVETLQSALGVMTKETANDTTLVVYRENRYCPATSKLPEHYLSEIRNIDGVEEVVPIQIAVNNCGASLDVIAFRGVPPETLANYNPDMEILDGSLEDWKRRSDGALVGKHFAARRGLKPGDQFEAVGVRVYVSGILDSPLPQDNNVAYVHLPFLQQATSMGLGMVTQFNVKVNSTDLLEIVSEKIDNQFKSDSAPTHTRPEKAFFAQTAKDMIELINFTRWLGLGSVIAVIALVANALLLIARGRVKESAVMQTIGFQQTHLAVLMLWEGLLLGVAGGVIGTLSATAFFSWKRFTFGNEGLTLAIEPSLAVTFGAIFASILLGVVAALWPAHVASRKPIVESLRTA